MVSSEIQEELCSYNIEPKMHLNSMLRVWLFCTEPQMLRKRLDPLFQLSQESLFTMQKSLGRNLPTVDLSCYVTNDFSQFYCRHLLSAIRELVMVGFRRRNGRWVDMNILVVKVHRESRL